MAKAKMRTYTWKQIIALDAKRVGLDVENPAHFKRCASREKSLRGFLRMNESTYKRAGFSTDHVKNAPYGEGRESFVRVLITRNASDLETYANAYAKRAKSSRKRAKATRKAPPAEAATSDKS